MISSLAVTTCGSRFSTITGVLLIILTLMPSASAVSQTNSLILGYSGSGISTDLRRVMDIEKIWEKHGLTVKSVYFNSGSVLTQAMSANAPHPYSAALFIDFLLSEEGQKIVVTTNRMPANSRVKSPESQLLEGQDVRTPDIFDIGRNYQAIGKRYQEIFTAAR